MKKNEKITNQKKKGKILKDFVPVSKNAVREMIPFKTPSEFLRTFKNEFEPIDLFPEWPTEEEVKNFDFSHVDIPQDSGYITKENFFSDAKNEEINLPDSILYHCQGQVKWIRPETWIKDLIVDKEIKKVYPNKNPIKFRSKVRQAFKEMQSSMMDRIPDDTKEDNQSINKSHSNISGKKPQNDFMSLGMNEVSMEDQKFRKDYADLLSLYENPLEYKVVYHIDTKIEREKEEKLNAENLNNTNINQTSNMPKTLNNRANQVLAGEKTINQILEENKLKDIKYISPGNIAFDEKLPNFCKWMSSLMQAIKDLEILKIESIIYPQKDGVPYYNPSGRYWLRLFHMGKYRKIEIDDRMPCTIFDEFIFPHCENVEEIWPALITKGILKLFGYKFNRMKYKQENILQEKADISILYSLCGFIPEHLNVNYIQEDKFENLCNLLNDTRYLNKQKYFLCYNNYSLESTSKKLDYKLNYKNRYGEFVEGVPQYKINQIMDQPFMGINIFKNYFSKMSKKNSSFDLNQGVFSDGSPEKNYENLISEANDNSLSESPNKKKASMKISMGDAKRLARLKAKLKNNQGIFNEEGNFRIPTNIETEKSINKLNPIVFKDDLDMIKQERDILHSKVRQSLLVKEKSIKISTSILNNLNYFIESNNQVQVEQKFIVNQVVNINSILRKGRKINDENNKLFYEKKTKNVYSDLIYSVSDVFYSGDEFNMKRLQPVDFTDLKQKILAAQTNFKLLSAQEKKNYITNIKELKLKHKEEKKARLMELNKPGEKVYLVKVQHGLNKIISAMMEDYTNDEVLMAKKCLLNNWRFPPAAYFENSFSKYDLAPPANKKNEGGNNENVQDEQKLPNSIKLMNTSWTKDFYVKMVKNINDDNLNISQMNDKRIQQTELDFYKNPKELTPRQGGGIWINWTTFLSIFKGFIILHNPKNYRSIVNVDSNWYNYKSDIYTSERFTFFFTSNVNNLDKNFLTSINPNALKDSLNLFDRKDVKEPVKENVPNPKDAKGKAAAAKDHDAKSNDGSHHNEPNVLNLITNNINGSNCVIHSRLVMDNIFDNNLMPNTKFFNSMSNSCINIVFEPNTSNSYLFSEMKFYIIFDLISFSGRKLFSGVKLTGHYSTFQFDEIIFEQDYYLVITGGLHPFGYNLRIMSDHLVETITNFNYIRRINNLNSYPVGINYPILEKNRIFLLAKIKIDAVDNSNLIFNLKQNEGNIDNNLKQYFDFYLIKKDKEKKININKMYDLEGSEEPQYINVTIIPPYNLPEGYFELEFLTNNADMKIEIIDMVDPYEISDKFTNNKHGIIMKEQVHIPEMVSFSLDIEFKKKLRPKSPKSQNSGSLQGSQSGGAGGNPNSPKEADFKKIEKSIRIIMEITKEDKIIYTNQFFTKTFINHLELTLPAAKDKENMPAVEVQSPKADKKGKGKDEPVISNAPAPFNMILRLDLSEAPRELQNEYEDTENEYFWFVRFFSTENIALMKDTSKEEREALLKEGWEQKNTGRAEKAKLSRKKYLLMGKKNRGEPLTPEEEQLLNEIRNRVILTNLEQEGKSKSGKDDPKNKDKKEINRDGKSANSKNSKNSNQKDKGKVNPLNDPNLNSKGQYLKQSFYQRMNRTRMLPKPENHCALYLKNFLSYAYRDRIMQSANKVKKYCLDEEKVNNIKHGIENRVQDYSTKRSREQIRFDERRKKMIDETKTINDKNINKRRHYSGKLNELMTSRDQIMNNIENLMETEKKLKEVLAGDTELDRAIAIYKETICDNNIYMKYKGLCSDIFKYISTRKEENYKNEIKKFNAKDKNGIIKSLEDLNSNNWDITEETVKKLNELAK